MSDVREAREWMEFAGYLKPENAAVLKQLWPTCECGAALVPDFTDDVGVFYCPFQELHVPAYEEPPVT